MSPCVFRGEPVRIPLILLLGSTWGVGIACRALALLWLEKEKVEDKCVVNCRPKHRQWSSSRRDRSGESSQGDASPVPCSSLEIQPKGWETAELKLLGRGWVWEPALVRGLKGEMASRAWPKQIPVPAPGQLGLQGGWSLEMLALHKNTLNQTLHSSNWNSLLL